MCELLLRDIGCVTPVDVAGVFIFSTGARIAYYMLSSPQGVIVEEALDMENGLPEGDSFDRRIRSRALSTFPQCHLTIGMCLQVSPDHFGEFGSRRGRLPVHVPRVVLTQRRYVYHMFSFPHAGTCTPCFRRTGPHPTCLLYTSPSPRDS